jgi:cobalamin biosynthesis protein CobW
MNALIPVTVVTGFLGSGKTTLLSSLIKNRQTRRLALLINEFGEISIDGALIRESASDDTQVQIQDFPHGLIAYGDDQHFVPALQAIAKRRAHIDHVLIETSGLALPTAVMEMLQSPELAQDFVLDATLAVVDTPLLLSDQFERDHSPHAKVADSVATLFERQLEYADVVVLNKIDALDENDLLLAETRVRERAPKVRFLELAYHAQLDIRLALGLRLHQPTSEANAHRFTPVALPSAGTALLANQEQLNGHTHSGLGGHIHGITTHKHFHEQDPGWLSFVLRSDEPQQAETLKTALIETAKAEPILRIKGFVRTADSAQGILIQGVRTRMSISANAAKKSARESAVVFIGYHTSRVKVATLLSELTGTLWK